MKNLKLIFLTFLFTSSFAFAKDPGSKKISRKPSQTEASAMNFTIVYGDKTTVFKVSKDKKGGRIDFSNNLGSQKTKIIPAADLEFLKSKVSNLTGPTNKKEFCTRRYIEVKTDSHQFVGCLGASNKLAQDIQEITNLITILF
jgi:hypothetical protein